LLSFVSSNGPTGTGTGAVFLVCRSIYPSPAAPATRMNRPPTTEPAIVAAETVFGQLSLPEADAPAPVRAGPLAPVESDPVPVEKNVKAIDSTVG
jgi:hypothetical protein